eukprot:gene4862-5330_t
MLRPSLFSCRGRVGLVGSKRFLNRILFEPDEVVSEKDVDRLVVRLPPLDPRANHIERVLKLEEGDPIKCGILHRGITDAGVVSFPAAGEGVQITLGPAQGLKQPPKPRVSLILALPRPMRLERLIPVITCLGVDQIALVGAKKVEKDYFGSHLLRRPEAMKDLLIEGLSQAAMDCHLPQVVVHKNLFSFLRDELAGMDREPSRTLRLIAHPPIPSDAQRSPSTLQSIEAHEIFRRPDERWEGKDRVILAIGPEGGWEAGEVQLFAQHGFIITSLGPRILRTDTAVAVLMGLVNEWLASRSGPAPC